MPIRYLHSSVIIQKLITAYRDLSFRIDPKLLALIQTALEQEDNAGARGILQDILDNAQIAEIEKIPPCQDTGSQVIFAELGRDLIIQGQALEEAVNTAIAQASQECYLRASICKDPLFDRSNTGDNRPAVFHVKLTEGDKLLLKIGQKGGGAENMSRIFMLSPSADPTQIIEKVVETVKAAGAKACPPLIIGIGIGGNFEKAALMAKEALFDPLDQAHNNPNYAKLELDILTAVNKTGIGPMALGGKTTALAVKIRYAPCHIASLPLAINIQCHSHRHLELEL